MSFLSTTAQRPRKLLNDRFASPIGTGPDHPITLERSRSHVVVRSGPVVIAESDRALEMQEALYQPVLYIPLEDVDRRLLRHSDHHTYCPYKGEASYYDILASNGTGLPRQFGTTTTRSRPLPLSKATWRFMPIE